MQLTPRFSNTRAMLLLAFFFLVCCGLGYQILNRASWRTTPALADVESYAQLVTGPAATDITDHMGMRVLVPYVAKPFYWLAKGRVGSWDPVMFGLLISDSFFYSLNRNLASACSLAAARKL